MFVDNDGGGVEGLANMAVLYGVRGSTMVNRVSINNTPVNKRSVGVLHGKVDE